MIKANSLDLQLQQKGVFRTCVFLWILRNFWEHLFCRTLGDDCLWLGTIHIWRRWKLSNFQDPPNPCLSASKIFPAPGFWTSRFKNWPHVLLFHLARKQCNGVTKGWLHCLTPESIGIFLVNNGWPSRTNLNSRRSRMAKTVTFWPRWQPFDRFYFENLSFFPFFPFFL